MSRQKLAAAVAAAATTLAAVVIAVGAGAGTPAQAMKPGGYEVWLIDQTDSKTGYGGYLHIFAGSDVERDGAGATPETIDLGDQAANLCMAQTGAFPVRPHMLTWKDGDGRTAAGTRYGILSWVASGHVTIHDGETGAAVACLRTSPGAGGARQAHASWPTPDGEHIVVSNQNGKKIERIAADWDSLTFTWEPAAELRLYEGTTPSGAPREDPALRPDNAPICTRVTRDGTLAFVSLRGGGAFVIDHEATPMGIVAEYDRATVEDNGCGQQETGGTMFFNAGAGAPGDPFGHTVYAVDVDDVNPTVNPPNQPAPRVVYTRAGDADAHGMALTKHEKYLLQGDRRQNDVTVVDTRKEKVVGHFTLAGPLSADPAPDLADVSPDAKLAFFAFRGPTPLSGGQDAVGTTPGLGIVKLGEGGKDGRLTAIAPSPRPTGAPDPHGIGVRIVE
jgi:hypothetical protein